MATISAPFATCSRGSLLTQTGRFAAGAGRSIGDRRAQDNIRSADLNPRDPRNPRMIVVDYPAGVIARTRTGLPLPLTTLSGAAITTAPVGGS